MPGERSQSPKKHIFMIPSYETSIMGESKSRLVLPKAVGEGSGGSQG